MDSNPSLIQIKSEIQHYDSIEQEIDDIKPIIVLGFTELSTGKLFFLAPTLHFTLCDSGSNWRMVKYSFTAHSQREE